MTRKMKYSLYKKYYSQYRAHDYDSKRKTIMVDLPDIKRKALPKEWVSSGGNWVTTPGGCTVTTWGSGLSMHHRVERIVEKDLSKVMVWGPWTQGYRVYEREIWPGVDRYERLIAAVEELEKIV